MDRDALSSVAGIVDEKGGFRVVVTQLHRFKHHVGKKERLFVVPDYKVKEPVPREDVPALIERVQNHVVKTLNAVNHCGGCQACCIIPYIPELNKPSYQRCRNCGTDVGCKLYFARPRACREFECMWLKSQVRNDIMPPELRPDRCGVIFVDRDTEHSKADVFEVVPGTPEALNNPHVMRFIDEMQRFGHKAKLITHFVGEDK